MKAVFEVKHIEADWQPPFRKLIQTMECVVDENEQFEPMGKENERGHVFKLIKCDGNKALVEFSHVYTLKGHVHPRNRQIWVGHEPISFTYLWGKNGITKSVRLREILQEQ